MIRRTAGAGCLGLLALTVLAGFALRQSELGRWVTGLVVVYGGTMLGGALHYETVPGVVVEVNRRDPPTAFSAGSLRVRYRDAEGREQVAFRRVMQGSAAFRRLEPGDTIDVWVCRSDPAVVRLVGYGTEEPARCGDRREAAVGI